MATFNSVFAFTLFRSNRILVASEDMLRLERPQKNLFTVYYKSEEGKEESQDFNPNAPHFKTEGNFTSDLAVGNVVTYSQNKGV